MLGETPSPRRSTRARKPVSYFGQDDGDDGDMEEPRSAKRQRKATPRPAKTADTAPASENGRAVGDDPSDGTPDLRDILKLSPEEIEEYEGWVELESEPAHFNYIVHSLGVPGVRFEEVVVMDEALVDMLQHPIHGFIFLFECEDAPEVVGAVDPPEGMWFARQTIANACASVAIFNVLMNAENVALGDKLKAFKGRTAGLSAAHRGVALAQDTFIRSTHNSFARRLDLLDADLCVQNTYDDRNKRTVAKSRPKKRKRKTINPDSAKHYVAYIPYDGKLWELDGLEQGVVSLGTYEGEWSGAVLPFIQNKAAELGDQANLLALCHNPLADMRLRLVANIASILELQRSIAKNPEWAVKLEDRLGWTNDDDKPEYAAALSDLDLTPEDVAAAPVMKQQPNGQDHASQREDVRTNRRNSNRAEEATATKKGEATTGDHIKTTDKDSTTKDDSKTAEEKCTRKEEVKPTKEVDSTVSDADKTTKAEARAVEVAGQSTTKDGESMNGEGKTKEEYNRPEEERSTKGKDLDGEGRTTNGIDRTAEKYETAEDAREAANRLCEEHKQLCSEYRQQRAAVHSDLVKADQRRKDLTPLVHAWLEILSEADILDTVAVPFCR